MTRINIERGYKVNGTERMREHRQRKREGMRVVPVEVHDKEIDGLIQCGLLPPDQRRSRDAIARAFGMLLDRLPPAKWQALVAGKLQEPSG